MINQKSAEQLSFEQLFAIIKQKISSKEKGSYSNSLVEAGLERIARKVGEEALEVVIASFVNQKNHDQKSHEELVGELCDLFYHSLILMASQNVSLEEIKQEFSKRNSKKK